ncbi:hypothetical protein [Candidatus Berkiella aquae]|uniref:Uncharacterized protein n=1 Tax=Candidatus Berkiella aquae TaxID=295108 RepID=A0A0Q9YMY0_9GAMM|nr:hypothetical protein [Candidatus Berkiella aquae]MCS5712663.1 hypothetical protein [Candidatus Berkiella aquae]
MTAIRTEFEAGCYAVTPSVQNIIILDRFRQINVAKVDDFSPLFQILKIKMEKYFSIETLIKANIIFSLARELGLQPGMFVDGDKAIIDHCRAKIAGNVLEADHELLLQELIDAWYEIANHPLLKKYIRLGEFMGVDNVVGCLFAPIGGYELFVNDFYTGCMKAFVNAHFAPSQLMEQFAGLLYSSFDGDGLQHDIFYCKEMFLKKSQLILSEMGNEEAKAKAYLVTQHKSFTTFKGAWFFAVIGWAKIELDDVENFPEAQVALGQLLDRKLITSEEAELKFQLTDLQAQLAEESPSQIFQFNFSHLSPIHDKNKLIVSAIEYAIANYAKQYVVKPYGKRTQEELPLYLLAGQGRDAENQLKVAILEGRAEDFQPFEWYAITQKAKSKSLKDITRQMIAIRAFKEEPLWLGVPNIHLVGTSYIVQRFVPPVTFQYRRLDNVIKGARKRDRIAMPSNALSLSEEGVDNLADSLQETLNLQEMSPNSCILL